MVTNNVQPVNPPSVVRQPFVPGALPSGTFAEQPLAGNGTSRSAVEPEPRKSFFRGVAVGLAIMIPLWIWLIIKLVR